MISAFVRAPAAPGAPANAAGGATLAQRLARLLPGSGQLRLFARRRGGAAGGAVTALMLGTRPLAVRVALPRRGSDGARLELRAGEPGGDATASAASFAAWKRAGLFRSAAPLLVLRTAQRQLLTIDQPQVPDAELPLAVRWPLAEAMECEPDSLLATAVALPRINDAQRTQVLAVGTRIEPVREQLALLRAAGIAPRSIDIADSALRGMALLERRAREDAERRSREESERRTHVDGERRSGAEGEARSRAEGTHHGGAAGSRGEGMAAQAQVVLAATGGDICLGLLHGGRFCALRTLALPGAAPRDAAAFEEQLALHLQRTTDSFERQATRLAVREVLALLPSIEPTAREDVRRMLPLSARWFDPADHFAMDPASAALLAGDEQLAALACVAAARLLEPLAEPAAEPAAGSAAEAAAEPFAGSAAGLTADPAPQHHEAAR